MGDGWRASIPGFSAERSGPFGYQEAHAAVLAEVVRRHAAGHPSTTPDATLLELLRERPRGACTICWRDMALALAGSTTQVACSREDGSGRTRWCQTFVVHCYRDGERRRESAKAGLVAELEGGLQ